jgi:general secretion pathway protein F
MRSFVLRGLSPESPDRVIDREVQALSAEAAQEAAEASGFIVLSVVGASKPVKPTATTWRGHDLAWWCRELRTLLGAGMTLVEALETMEAQATPGATGPRAQSQSALLARLRQGESLSRAMEGVGGFPPVLLASVRAAERTSTLGSALDDYLRHHEALDRLRRRVVQAAMYPAMVCAVGALVCGFLLFGVLPRFAGILEGSPESLLGGTGLLLQLSQGLRAQWPVALAVLLATGVVLSVLWQRGVIGRTARWFALQIPPVADAIQAFELSKLYQAMALLYRGGFPLEEALDVCRSAAVAEQKELATRLAQSQEALQAGQGVAKALALGSLTDGVTQRLLGVGERAGSFDQVLQVIADRHAQTFGDFMDRLMRVVEPLLLLLVASAVGGVVVMMYLPIFDIATGLQA